MGIVVALLTLGLVRRRQTVPHVDDYQEDAERAQTEAALVMAMSDALRRPGEEALREANKEARNARKRGDAAMEQLDAGPRMTRDEVRERLGRMNRQKRKRSAGSALALLITLSGAGTAEAQEPAPIVLHPVTGQEGAWIDFEVAADLLNLEAAVPELRGSLVDCRAASLSLERAADQLRMAGTASQLALKAVGREVTAERKRADHAERELGRERRRRKLWLVLGGIAGTLLGGGTGYLWGAL